MITLIDFFKENFKPYDTIPIVALSECFILKNGYSKNDIGQLLEMGDIMKVNGDGYKLTNTFLKKWAGSSYKYIPEYMR